MALSDPHATTSDLVLNFKNDWPLAEFDVYAQLTLYRDDEKGYIDYSSYQAQWKRRQP